MKLAFSTLGCPDWSFSEIFSTAKDLKFDGIEIRGIANELYVPRAKRFLPEKIDGTIEKLRAGNIEIPVISSGISVGTLKTDEAKATALREAKEYIDVASKVSCSYIRVMISGNPHPEPVDMEAAKSLYSQMCEYGKVKGVTPLIETNGVLSDSNECLRFIESIESDNKGVLWDVHHPYRYFGESAEKTLSIIGKYIKHVHVKDSVVKDEKVVYRMMGYGDVPVFDALKQLKALNYEGYVSLEWVKRWNPDLEAPGIVFAHFMSYMTFTLERL